MTKLAIIQGPDSEAPREQVAKMNPLGRHPARAIESTDNAKKFVVENITRLALGQKLESIVDAVEM